MTVLCLRRYPLRLSVNFRHRSIDYCGQDADIQIGIGIILRQNGGVLFIMASTVPP